MELAKVSRRGDTLGVVAVWLRRAGWAVGGGQWAMGDGRWAVQHRRMAMVLRRLPSTKTR